LREKNPLTTEVTPWGTKGNRKEVQISIPGKVQQAEKETTSPTWRVGRRKKSGAARWKAS